MRNPKRTNFLEKFTCFHALLVLFLILLILHMKSDRLVFNLVNIAEPQFYNDGPNTESYDWCPMDIPLFGPSDTLLQKITRRKFSNPFFNFKYGHNFSICLIPKNMHTTIANFVNVLNKDTFPMQSVAADLVRYAYGNNEHMKYVVSVPHHRLSTLGQSTRVVIIRDPMDRFVSFWANHCYHKTDHPCCGCGTNLTCFVEKAYRQAYAIGVPGNKKLYYRGDNHYLPQSWQCGLRYLLSNNVSVNLIKYAKGDSTVSQRVYETMEHIIPVQRFKNEVHTFLARTKIHGDRGRTKELVYQMLTSDNKLKNCVRKLYRPDYTLFEHLKFENNI